MKLKTIAEAEAEGYTINNHAPGRPTAYKGETMRPTEIVQLLTPLEADLLRTIRNIVKFAGGTRELDANGMRILAQGALNRAESAVSFDPVAATFDCSGRADAIIKNGDTVEFKTNHIGVLHADESPYKQTR